MSRIDRSIEQMKRYQLESIDLLNESYQKIPGSIIENWKGNFIQNV